MGDVQTSTSILLWSGKRTKVLHRPRRLFPPVRTYVRVPCTSCADPTCTIAHCIALLYGTGLRWRGTGVGDTRRFDTPFSRWRVSFRINLTAGITRIDEGKLDRVSIIDKDFRLDRDYFSFLEREVMDSRRRWKKKGYSCSLRYGRSFAGFVHAIAVYVPYIMLWIEWKIAIIAVSWLFLRGCNGIVS